MCDFCGCPAMEPFATLTEEHDRLLMAAERFASGNLAELDAFRESWREHRAREHEALQSLVAATGLEMLMTTVEHVDTAMDTILGKRSPAGKALKRAMQDHAGNFEFGLFPHLVFAVDPNALSAAADHMHELR